MNIHQMYQQTKAQWQPVMNNPVVPCYKLHQNNRCLQTVSMQHYMIPPIHNYPSEDYISQQWQGMTSTSEEKEETLNNSKNEW